MGKIRSTHLILAPTLPSCHSWRRSSSRPSLTPCIALSSTPSLSLPLSNTHFPSSPLHQMQSAVSFGRGGKLKMLSVRAGDWATGGGWRNRRERGRWRENRTQEKEREGGEGEISEVERERKRERGREENMIWEGEGDRYGGEIKCEYEREMRGERKNFSVIFIGSARGKKLRMFCLIPPISRVWE